MTINLVGFMGSDPEYLDRFIQERLDRAAAEKVGDPTQFAARFSKYLEDIDAADESIDLDSAQANRPNIGDNDSAGAIGGGDDFDALRGGGDGAGSIGIEGDGDNRSEAGVLTTAERNLVHGTALLEFNMAMMSNRSLHKSTKQRNEATKKERKEVEADDMRHHEEMAAKARAERRASNRKKG